MKHSAAKMEISMSITTGNGESVWKRPVTELEADRLARLRFENLGKARPAKKPQ